MIYPKRDYKKHLKLPLDLREPYPSYSPLSFWNFARLQRQIVYKRHNYMRFPPKPFRLYRGLRPFYFRIKRKLLRKIIPGTSVVALIAGRHRQMRRFKYNTRFRAFSGRCIWVRSNGNVLIRVRFFNMHVQLLVNLFAPNMVGIFSLRRRRKMPNPRSNFSFRVRSAIRRFRMSRKRKQR